MFRRRKGDDDGSMGSTAQGGAESGSGDLPPLKPFMRASSEETLAPARPAVPTPPAAPAPRRLVDLPGAPRPGAASLAAALSNTGVSSASVPAPVMQQSESKKLIVGREIKLNGEITSCEHLVVEGSVEAMLSDGKMVDIAESGTFRGSVECETAQIRGRFDGDLTCNERLVVHSTGRVVGKVRYRQLEVERGGEISGDMQTIPSGGQAGASSTAPSSTVTPIFPEDEQSESGAAAASADR
jgi:cytoskeletal protein CcmA (bactofilin family)